VSQEPISDITSDDRLWAAFAYPTVGLLSLIILLFWKEKSDRPFIRYHAVQAIAFSVVVFVIAMVFSVCTFIIGAICIFPLAWLSTFWPAYGAYNGKYVEIPFVTNFIKQQKWVS
jgi:uncharacterized membrane protein